MVGRTADRVGALVVALVAALVAAPPIRDTDWGWHVAQGERVLAERALPWDDVWMWSSDGVRAVPYAWGFDVLIALADRVGGVPGVAAFGMGLSALVGLALHRALRWRGAAPLAAVGVAVTILLAVRLRLIPRPHLVGDVFFLLTLSLLLDGARARSWRVWLLPPLMVLWANLHPSALLGGGFLAVALVGEALRRWRGKEGLVRADLVRYALVLGACAVACFLTPLGITQLDFLFLNRGWAEAALVTELRPLSWRAFHMDRVTILVAALVALPALLRRLPLRDPAPWLVAAAAGVLAAKTSRFYVEWLLLTAFAAAPAYAAPAGRRARAVARAALGLALGRVALDAAPELLTLDRPLLSPTMHCERTADFLATTPVPGPVFNSQRLGGYLVYRLRGRPKLFWDGRLHFYPSFIAEGRFEVLQARFGFRTLVVAEREGQVPAETEAGDAAWACVHFDDEARVFVDARDPLAARGLRFARFRWERTAGGIERLLVPDLEHPAEAAAELETWARQQPDGYYAHLALGRARLALGDRAGARAAAAVADRKRSTATSRALLAASR